jgi:energy-coupling factor transporter transmembrane protein EcfT
MGIVENAGAYLLSIITQILAVIFAHPWQFAGLLIAFVGLAIFVEKLDAANRFIDETLEGDDDK